MQDKILVRRKGCITSRISCHTLYKGRYGEQTREPEPSVPCCSTPGTRRGLGRGHVEEGRAHAAASLEKGPNPENLRATRRSGCRKMNSPSTTSWRPATVPSGSSATRPCAPLPANSLGWCGNNVTIDWTLRENVRANLRRLVRRTLNGYGWLPAGQTGRGHADRPGAGGDYSEGWVAA